MFGLVQGWIDDDIDTIGRDEVLQGRDVDENRELNLQAMTNAKQVATQVALERLGYEVDVTVGQFVTEVDEGFPASGVIEPGEIIVAVEGETFDDENDLTRLLEGKVPGDTVTVTVQPLDGDRAGRRAGAGAVDRRPRPGGHGRAGSAGGAGVRLPVRRQDRHRRRRRPVGRAWRSPWP